jgi:hypothetical protein
LAVGDGLRPRWVSGSEELADGHPDLNGFWKGMKDTKPGGNIAKDLPGHKLPLTPAGEAAWKHNTTATVDPEAICILGASRATMRADCRSWFCRRRSMWLFSTSTATTG